ncbi:MAG: hypothetical protein IPK97_20405 [Ahniella sp.]|nr:hypothetical protein [Ahniella sp.]
MYSAGLGAAGPAVRTIKAVDKLGNLPNTIGSRDIDLDLDRSIDRSDREPQGSVDETFVVEMDPAELREAGEFVADGSVRFQRWKRGEAIDKPLPDGSAPAWGTVQSRYWKNRAHASATTGEFSLENLRRMQRGSAPQDYNPRNDQFESRELHHVIPQRADGPSNPLNLRELTPDQHGAVDPYRHSVPTVRGIR